LITNQNMIASHTKKKNGLQHMTSIIWLRWPPRAPHIRKIIKKDNSFNVWLTKFIENFNIHTWFQNDTNNIYKRLCNSQL
jgi:hypothetical protein